MMYAAAIKNLNLAIECIKRKDLLGKSLHIQKTNDIINELSLSLDLKKGGEVSSRLESLYQYILKQLTMGNIKRNDSKPLENSIKILITLESAWQIVVEKNEGEHQTKIPTDIRRITAHC